MPDLAEIYRHQLVRSTLGMRPAIIAEPADSTALDRFCQRLADADEAIQMLCAKGYGVPSQSLADLVRRVPTLVPRNERNA